MPNPALPIAFLLQLWGQWPALSPLEHWIGNALTLVLLWKIFRWGKFIDDSPSLSQQFRQALTMVKPARVGMFALALVHLGMIFLIASASFWLQGLGLIAFVSLWFIQDFHFGPGTVTVYTRAAPNTTSFRAEPCTSPPAAGPKARPSAHRR